MTTSTVSAALLLSAFCGLTHAAAVQRGASDPAGIAGTIEKADKDFIKALIAKDLAALDAMYDETYVFTNPNGRVSTKKDMMASLKAGVINVRSQEISDVKVQAYGDTAVETGKLVGAATWDGQESGGTFRFTRVWVKRNGNWLTVAFQETKTQ